MYKRIITIIAFGMSLYGCGNNDMCSTDNDCINMCRTYENNSILYACMDGNCRCVDEKKLNCIHSESVDKCKEICDMYRPGTEAQCIKFKCTCVEPGAETEQEQK